jgi:hypothetical protein
MKTESLQTQKSSPETSSTADTEIFTMYRLLQNQKSLTKTVLLQTQKSSSEPSSMGDAEILSAYRLYIIRHQWRKLSCSRPWNHHQNRVPRLTPKSSPHIESCRIKIHWRKLCRCTQIFTAHRILQTQKSSPETSSTADIEIFTAHRQLQNQKSSSKTSATADTQICTAHRLLQNKKLSPETNATADTQIFTAYRLLQNKKS